MAPLSMTLSDFEGHFCCLKPFWLTFIGNVYVLFSVCLRMNRKAQVPCILNALRNWRTFQGHRQTTQLRTL